MTNETPAPGWTNRPHSQWEARPSFIIKSGKTLYPIVTEGRAPAKAEVSVFDAKPDVEDVGVELGPFLVHKVGSLTWDGREISFVWTNEDLQRQGIATEMLRIARVIEPKLRHSSSHRSEDARKWIAAVDPDESWLESRREDSSVESSAPRRWWHLWRKSR